MSPKCPYTEAEIERSQSRLGAILGDEGVAPALRPAVAVSFGGLSSKLYDYLIPDGVTVKAGDKVVIETRNGGEAQVTVVAVKNNSDRATVPFVRVVEMQPEESETCNE